MINRQQFSLLVCCVYMVALIYSKFALSVCMISFMVISLFNFEPGNGFPVKLNPSIKENFRFFLQQKSFLVITGFFFMVLFSGLYSSDWDYLLERLRIRLPFLILPFAFASIPSFSERQYLGLFYFFVGFMSLSCATVAFDYWNNFEAINANMKLGKPIPTPMNHIRYSLMIALSIIAGTVLVVKNYYLRFKWERLLILVATLFLFLFIHILSVRSGLLALYCAIFVLSLRYIFRRRSIIIGASVISALVVLPLIAYKTLPSFKSKVHYTLHDFSMYMRGKSETYSDAERFVSLTVGMQIGKQHPIIGIGAGDLKQEVKTIYAKQHPTIKEVKMPHNQFISTFAGMGIIGLVIFLLIFFYPLFYRGNYANTILLALHMIIFISFLMENTIENAIGTGIYVFFLLVLLNHLNGQKQAEEKLT